MINNVQLQQHIGKRIKSIGVHVRKVWAGYIAKHNTVALKTKIDGKFLHEYLMAMAKEYAEKKITAADVDAKILAEINRFIGSDEKGMAVTK